MVGRYVRCTYSAHANVIAQCNQLGCNARNARMLSSAVCASAMQTGIRSTPNIAGNFKETPF